MSSLAELPELVGFFSYSREDDEAFKGKRSALRDAIHRELGAQLGRSKKTFRLWQDQEAIAPGGLWESEIKTAVEQSVFFIPIVTPRAVNSKYCLIEFEAFLARERALERTDLVFPILYITVPALENEAQWRGDPVLSTIGRRQYVDWRPHRHLDVDTAAVREAIGRFCAKIVESLHQPWVSPEQRRRQEEAEARERAEAERRRSVEAEAQRVEDERRRQDEEAKRVAEEERRRQTAAEAERQRLEREAAAEREAEERRKKQEDERRQTEEERRRKEAEVKRRAEQEQAFTAAKRSDTVGAVDEFLTRFPESHLADETRELRAMLVAREEAFKGAMASVALLKTFLQAYPKGVQTDVVRRRLRSLEPKQAWPSSRFGLVTACVLGVVVVGSVGLWLFVDTRQTPVSLATPPEQSPSGSVSQAAPFPSVVPLSPDRERALKPKDTFKECNNCPEMVVVRSGSFTMGSPDDEVGHYFDEGPEHRVTIAVPFAVGRFAVTFDEWDACVADGGCNDPADSGLGRGRWPVISVSWNNTKTYLAWLVHRTGKPYRLLSEAEFEYAARADSKTVYPWGDMIGTGNANCNGCGSRWDNQQTAPVGSFAANEFGLYDMAGNVWEWVEDCYHNNYDGAPSNGSAWTSGGCESGRVVRGGSWNGSPWSLRSAFRRALRTDASTASLGFRVGRTLTP